MNNKRREYQWRTAVLMFGFGVIAALASSALLVTVYAQPESQRDSASDRITVSNKRSEKARPFGASGSKVTLQLTFDTGAVFTVTQFEDAPIRVQQNDSTVAIAAHIDADNQVTADIFVGFSADSQDLSIKGRRPEISSFAIGRDTSELPITDFGVRVRVVGIAYDVGRSTEPKETSRFHILDGEFEPDPGGGSGYNQCCVTCGSITVCGCKVIGPCGSCCSGTCCPI